jgi:hypothetical protein
MESSAIMGMVIVEASLLAAGADDPEIDRDGGHRHAMEVLETW